MDDVVLSFYDYTGKFCLPWAETGYRCYCIDIQHPQGESAGPHPNITFVGGDMREWRPHRSVIDRVRFAASFSPCDDLAVSGARWFRDKGLRRLGRAIELFAIGKDWIEWLEVPGLCEHPRSCISSYFRKADFRFNPCDYTAIEPGDNYTKDTCIWGFNGFVMPPPDRDLALPPPDDRIHKCPPGPERRNFRSATPMGFARAVYRANAGQVLGLAC